MHAMELSTLLEGYEPKEQIPSLVRSLRHDDLVWGFLLKADADQTSTIKGLLQTRKLNPGSLGLITFAPELIQNGYPDCRLTAAVLEDCMAQYETFIQHREVPINLEQSAKLALVLIEKRKISPSWSVILLEIVNRMHISSQDELFRAWGSALVIAANLDKQPAELLEDLLKLKTVEQGMKTFIHVLLSLPITEDNQVQIIGEILDGMPIDVQEKLINSLMWLNEPELSEKTAEELLNKHKSSQSFSKNTQEIINSLENSVQTALDLKRLAGIAQIAGETELARTWLNQSAHVFNVLAHGIETQKAGVTHLQSGGGGSEDDFSDKPESKKSTVNANTDLMEGNNIVFFNEPSGFGIIREAKKIHNAGNPALAKAEIENNFSTFRDELLLSELTDFQPKFNPTWRSAKVVNDLLEMECFDQAVEVAKEILKTNPTSVEANLLAVRAMMAAGKAAEALPRLEWLVLLDAQSSELQRELASCNQSLGNIEENYKIRKRIIENPDASLVDLIGFANAALKVTQPNEVFEVTEKILAQDPNHAAALALNGAAHALIGDNEKALISLTQAIELGTDDPQPWILLADLYQRQNNLRLAVETLRNGLVSLPSNREISKRLAEVLMSAGLVAEALPILNELSLSSNDLEMKLTQSKAMKTLGLLEYGDQIAKLYEANPTNGEVAFDFAEELIGQGKRAEARKVIEGFSCDSCQNSDWALTFADVYIGIDFQNCGEPKATSGHEVDQSIKILDEILSGNPENQKAQLLRAELLLRQNQHQTAYDRYTKLIGKQNLVEKTLFERIQAGFALSAAFLGKFEVAIAAIREAVALKPEWTGLNRVMAQVYAMSGEVNEAMAQAERVLNAGTQVAADLMWFVDFASKIGMSEVAETKLRAELEVQPENRSLQLKLADLYIKSNRIDEAKEIAESLKGVLSPEIDEADLVVCARLFEALGDGSSAQTCLQYRSEKSNSKEAIIELAASYYNQSKFEKCLETLAYLAGGSNGQSWEPLFAAETLFHIGQNDSALTHLREIEQGFDRSLDVNLELLPESWNRLLVEKDPVASLSATVAFASGKMETCADVVLPWVNREPTNATARIIAIECSLANNDGGQVEELLKDVPGEMAGELVYHLLGLKIETLLEGDRTLEAQRIRESSADTIDPCLSATGIRLMVLQGHLAEAESSFDDLLTLKESISSLDLYLQAGIFRNLVRSATILQRWNDALVLVSEAATRMPWNRTIVMQYLTTLVQAQEFENSTAKLSILAHSPTNYLQQINVEDEFNWVTGLLNDSGHPELERWLLRGKMALAPTTENIRAFAMVTPNDQDVANMVTALWANGQGNTGAQVAKKFNKSAAVQFALALTLAETNGAGAIEALNSALTLEPLFPVALVLRSTISEGDGKTDLAINDIEEAISDWPNETLWRVRASKLWQRIGNLQNAIRQMDAAHKNAPDDASISVSLSKLYLAVGQGDLSIELMEGLSAQLPNQFEIWEVLADAYAQTGKMDEALDAAKKASDVNPFSTRPYLLSGKIHLEQGDLDQALTQAKKAADQNKKDAEAILFLARVLNERGEKQQALAALEMTRNCENTTVQTMIEHVNLVKVINGGANAKELISSMASQYPENVELMKLLAHAQVENGDLRDAELTAKRALLVDPEEADLHLFLGKINADSGQLDQAVHHLSQGITRRAENMEGYLTLSQVYEQQREYSKAIETLQKAIDANPNEPRSYTAIANLYKNAKNYSAAEKALQKAAELDPKDVTIRRQLGALLALNLVHHSQEMSSQT
jgi:tetratricopeptide (TPR) repeat protein